MNSGAGDDEAIESIRRHSRGASGADLSIENLGARDALAAHESGDIECVRLSP